MNKAIDRKLLDGSVGQDQLLPHITNNLQKKIGHDPDQQLLLLGSIDDVGKSMHDLHRELLGVLAQGHATHINIVPRQT